MSEESARKAMQSVYEEHVRLQNRIVELEAALAAEREACAKIAENYAGPDTAVELVTARIAAAIRARGTP